jgi:small subunit ribosomal protein S8e
MGRQNSLTKLGSKKIHTVRVRGGNLKYRALRLDSGNFSWGSEAISRKTRIVAVVYNASDNDLVRTNTLVKNAIVQVDAAPFRQWFETHYGVVLGKKKADEEETKVSNKVQRKHESRKAQSKIESNIKDQFAAGRLYACISSRPGQSGRADGYILEGKELDFYVRKIKSKK